MDKAKDLTTSEKQKIKLLCEGMSTSEISKDLCRNHGTIKKAVENNDNLRPLWAKEKSWDPSKQKKRL